jgi:hypothetical protein
MALFIRPNLLLVGAVFLAFVVWSAAERSRLRSLLWFAVGGAPLVLAVASINTVLYGLPLSAGHGSLGELYSWTFVGQNLIDYPKWLWATETPFIALSLMPLIAWRRSGLSRGSYGFLVSFIAAVWLSYVFYRAYGLWLYLRFLLPIIPLLVVLAAVGLAVAVRRISETGGQIAVALVVLTAACRDPASGPPVPLRIALSASALGDVVIDDIRLTVYANGTCTAVGDAEGLALADLFDVPILIGTPLVLEVPAGDRTCSIIASAPPMLSMPITGSFEPLISRSINTIGN